MERTVGPQEHRLHRLQQRQIGGGHRRHVSVHPHEDKGRPDRALRIEPEDAVLVRPRGLQPRQQRREVGHQPVQVGHARQLVPVAHEEQHQVRAQLGVGVGHAHPGQPRHRLDRALDRGQAFVGGAEDHRHQRPAPAGEQERPVVAGEQGLDPGGGQVGHARAPCRTRG